MNSLVLYVLPVSLALAHLSSAAESGEAKRNRERSEDRPARMMERSATIRPQAQPQRMMPQQARSLERAEGASRVRPTYNPGMGVRPTTRPRIMNEPVLAANNPRRVFTPTPVRTETPAEAVRPPTVASPAGETSGTRDGNEGRTRNWGGNREGNRNIENPGAVRGGSTSGWRDRDGEGRGSNTRRDDDADDDDDDADDDKRRGWRDGRRNDHRGHGWDRTHRHRDWWRSRYSRFALFGGGYYYWNSGYWYPAYGYDPYFSTYTYDAPIYSYGNRNPGEVIAGVQQELQERGFYRGVVDGSFGRLTRQALLDFQNENGLPVTGEIDQNTLSALGFE